MKSAAANRKIRIMVVEDHVLVRKGLVAAANEQPDIEVVAEVDDGRQALEAYRSTPADVVVLDLRMPGMDGVEIVKSLRREFGPVRILMLSSYGGSDDISRAMQAGALGYIVKGMDLDDLLEGIRAVNAGEQYLPSEIANRLTDRSHSNLSDRELEVLKLIVQGRSNKQIAEAMGIVEGTVKAHLVHIFAKLGAVDRAQAIAIAIRRQLFQLE